MLYQVRDRPFNLQGGLWFFVSFRKFISDNTRVRISIFLSRKALNCFPEFNIRLYDKNSESYYFFFLHQNQNIFFSNIGNQNIFLEKNHNPPWNKWSVPNSKQGHNLRTPYGIIAKFELDLCIVVKTLNKYFLHIWPRVTEIT